MKYSHPKAKKRHDFPKRYVVALLAFLGVACASVLEVDLSIALLAMTRTAPTSNRTRAKVQCPMLVHDEGNATRLKDPTYSWDSREQGLILGSFYYGYIVTQLPGGYAAEASGPRRVLGIGILLSAALAIATPAAASLGPAPLVATRVLQGLSEGVVRPAANVLVGRWSPRLERSRFSSAVMSGGAVGNALALPLAALISTDDNLGGWPAVFTLFGVFSCAWFVVWTWAVCDSPKDHPTISPAETQLIMRDSDNTPTQSCRQVPWCRIATSLPVWAVAVAHVGNNFAYLFLLTEMPHYMEDVLHFNMRENGVLNALPYLVQALGGWASSFAADSIRKSDRLSVTTIRKIFNSVGLLGPAACLLCVPASGCRPRLIVALVCVAFLLNGCVYSGFNVTHVDINPKLAGTLFGITNTFANFPGIINPALVGYLTSKGETIAGWNQVFYVVSFAAVFSAAFYAAFASAEPQHWDDAKETTTSNELNTLISKKTSRQN